MAGNNSEQVTGRFTRLLKIGSPLWSEHGLPILLYLALTILFTWPMVPRFTTHIIGSNYDAYNGLWVMWHTKEALLGHQPLFDLPILYYPEGATLLTHVPGPVTGLFALPFWPWGAEAAHNGAVLISFVLTGYFTYLLGRKMGLERPVSFFAGLLLLAAPMHLNGLLGHTTKVFLGGPPLVIFCLYHVLDQKHRERPAVLWAVATGFAFLFTLLHDSFQFITAGMAVLLVALFFTVTGAAEERIRLLRRLLWVILASLIIAGPLLVMTALAAYDPAITFDHNLTSFKFQPDTLEFILPTPPSRLFGPPAEQLLLKYQIEPTIETTVSISWAALALMLIAAIRGNIQGRFWVVFGLFWVILSLGPALRLFNQTTFTEYGLPVILPYAFLTELPGLDFLRTPGRFMQIGFAVIGIAAAWGLAWLRQRWPRRATVITIAAVFLVLLESWPQSWPMLSLNPVPDFYRQLAGDEEMYGVLDLPITPDEEVPVIMYNATYQIYQMIHSKGIPMGYISRTYDQHPIFPCLYNNPLPDPSDLMVDGQTSPCPFHPFFDLPDNNYRYVVWHKAQPEYSDYRPGAPGELAAAEFLSQYFTGQTPLVDDDLAMVYALPQTADTSVLPTALAFGSNWHAQEGENDFTWRWAESPATLILSTPRYQEVILEILIFSVYVPPEQNTLGQGRLQVELDGRFPVVVDIVAGQMTAVPLELQPGKHTLTLTLEAGSYQPGVFGTDDWRWLSFAVHSLNLRTRPE
jgi:hypothetical protein